MELIRTEGQGKRTQARWLSFGINGLGAALMIVVFSMTAGLTGLEIGVAGGTAVVGQRLLEAVFGEDAVRRLAKTAREDLHARCQRLLAGRTGALPGPAGDLRRGRAGGARRPRRGACAGWRPPHEPPRRRREASRLDRRLEALNEARELAAGALPDDVLDGVLQVLERASSRRSLSADHTVVGFFGATGSGKSSLFNAVSGEEIATAAARRPTTSEPLAGIWGAEGSEALLDWLDVRKRHHAAPVPGFADEGTGLILLDLPDFDSTRAANREIVQRMVGLVDVLVWVLDPQKYADAAVHNDFLAPLASHGAVTLVVLNQIDRLPERDVPPVLESLKGILARDGLGKVQVIGASAVAGHRRGQGPGRHPPGGHAAAGPVPAPRRGRHRRRRPGWPRRPAAGEAAGVKRGIEGAAGGGAGRRGQRPAGGGRRGPVVPAGGDPPHRLAGDALAGPVPARSAAAAQPAPGGRQARSEPDLAAAGRRPGAGPDGCRRPGIRRCGVRRRPGPLAGRHPRRRPRGPGAAAGCPGPGHRVHRAESRAASPGGGRRSTSSSGWPC